MDKDQYFLLPTACVVHFIQNADPEHCHTNGTAN
jgi:hypothetical protein